MQSPAARSQRPIELSPTASPVRRKPLHGRQDGLEGPMPPRDVPTARQEQDHILSEHRRRAPSETPRSEHSEQETPRTSLEHAPAPVIPARAAYGAQPNNIKENPSPEIRGWPNGPASLEQGGWVFWLVVVLDVLLIIVAICFMVIAILGKVLNDKSVARHSWGLTVITVNRFGVTAYNILFAAIAGRAIEMMATCLTERGATIGRLEQLFGSLTVASTVKTLLMLRSYNMLALLLLLFWALSPLGGQGILRILSVEDRRVVTLSPVYSLNTSAAIMSVFIHDPGYQVSGIDAVYLASMIAPNATQRGPQDSWGNLKIPRLASLTQDSPSGDGWKEVPETSVSYSSLIGISVANVSSNGNSSFTIPSSYFALSCPQGPQLIPYDDEVLWFSSNATGHLRGSGQLVNGTGSQRFPDSDYNGEGGPIATFSIGTFTPFTPTISAASKGSEPRSIYFQSEATDTSGDVQNITALNCLLTYQNVESQVKCQGKSCRVIAMRSGSGNPDYTPLDDQIVAEAFFNYFSVASGTYDSLSEFVSSSLLEQYMKVGYSPLGSPDRILPTNLSTVAGPLLTERLSRLMNTFYLPSLSIETVTGEFAPAEAFANDTNTDSNVFVSDRALATVTTFEKRFVCSDLWFAFLLISSTVLSFSAVIGTGLKYFATNVPDILNHISSWTRDNPNVTSVPSNGTFLGGYDRARLIKHVRVKLGDVQPGGPVGHVAIMSADDGLGALNRRRKYE